MKRTPLMLGASALGLACWMAAPASAHEGHVHKAMGTVASIDATHIAVAESGGKTETIGITGATKFKKGSTTVSSADVTPNSKVVVKFTESKSEKTASEVDLSSGSSSKKGSTKTSHTSHSTTTTHAQ